MLAITFGVLLAFGLNATWERRQADAFTATSLRLMTEELARNYAATERSLDYHVELLPRMRALGPDAGLVGLPYRGFQPPQLETAAYRLALESAVFARMEPETSEALIGAYTQFERVTATHEVFAEKVPDLIVDTDGLRDPRFTRFAVASFTQLIYVEGEALNAVAPVIDEDGAGAYWTVLRPVRDVPAEPEPPTAYDPE